MQFSDQYRWPLRDRRVFDKWRKGTEWGQIFARYGANDTPLADASDAPIPTGSPGGK